MVEANMPLVGFTINKYLKSASMDYDDMTSVGYIGLCKAVSKYRPESGYKFSTYAVMTIVRTIQRDMLPMKRRKRGFGCITLSFDQLLEDADNGRAKESMLGYEPDFANNVIEKILYEPLWKLCPTQTKLLRTEMTLRELGKMEGVSSFAINTRRKMEFQKAKDYLESIGIYGTNII